ncbi:rho GDP-dissociation inhibitor 1-like protein [Euroglyphus maynei]|uniref:Rho GDP-dissociation inhibitor 3 n=1 Tax=Euroglyphus maynei TaxID=6958 RepID=A0A1Y3B9S2_EURMA|nr:rho GDP-dissociation inhibitor 1-like protein [Euroglyphus maynei]
MSAEDNSKNTNADNNGGDGDELNLNYKPPAEKSLSDIVSADKDDESLMKYKESLLGKAVQDIVVVDETNPKRVIVKALSLLVDGRPDMVIDLSQGVESVKKKVYTIKDGIEYRIKIDFYVQREIVTGLKFQQKIYRHGMKVLKTTNMVGSYAPKHDLQSYTTPVEEMPSGMLARGTYTVKSLFTDDDDNEHLKWEWSFELKKDWD